MTFGLTAQQRSAVNFIRRYIVEHDGVSPSFQDIAIGIGVKHRSGITRLVRELEERGAIRRLPRRGRALTLEVIPEDGWRPIKDAPRDRTVFVGRRGSKLRAHAHYSGKAWRHVHTSEPICFIPTHWTEIPPPVPADAP